MRIHVVMAAALTLLPTVSLARTAVVLPIDYQAGENPEKSPLAIEKIWAKVKEGAAEANFEIMPDEQIRQLRPELLGDSSSCSTQVCLADLAKALKADEAVYIRVFDDTVENVHYKVNLITAYGQPRKSDQMGGFFAMLDEIKHLVAISLMSSSGKPQTIPRRVEPTQVELTPAVTPAPPVPSKEDTPPPNGLSSGPFWIATGTTVGIALTYSIFEVLTFSTRRSLDSDKWSSLDDWNSAKEDYFRLRTASRVLLGATATCLITTTVLFLLTDFTPHKDKPLAAGLPLPMITDHGALLVFEGRF